MSLVERLKPLAELPAEVPVPTAPAAAVRPSLASRLQPAVNAQAQATPPAPERRPLAARLQPAMEVPVPAPAQAPQRRSLSAGLARLAELPPAPQASAQAPRKGLAERLRSLAGQQAPVAAPAAAAPALSERLIRVQPILAETGPRPVTIPFGPWLPDLPDFANPGATVAKNVIPAVNSYGPFKALQAATDALDAAALGATLARDTSGNYYNYAGDVSKLYEVRASGVIDKSKGGGYSTGSEEVWEFVHTAGKTIGTNFTDPVQSIVTGAAGLFSDLFTSTLTPRFRHLAVIREFLFGGNSNDATDGDVPYRTWWSARNDPLDMDPDAQTQSDSEDRPQGGAVQRIVGGLEYGLLFQENAVTRITYVGPSPVFQFDSIDRARGTPIPNSVIGHGRFVYSISLEGFQLTDGTQSYSIGANQVDKTFWAQFDVADAAKVSSAIDPLNKVVAWGVPVSGGVFKLFLYNWEDRKFSEVEIDLEILVNTTSEGYTLEELDAVALDSAADTTLSANEASGQTIISVTSVSGFSVGDTARITLNDATIHQSKINAVGASTITIDDSLPSASDSGKRFVRTTIDVLTPGLDSAQWKGGGLRFGAFDTAHKLAYFDGATLKATIETEERNLFAGRQAQISKLRPLIDGGTLTAAVGRRNRLIDNVVYGPSNGMNSIGEISVVMDKEARYQRIRCIVAAGSVWKHGQGVEVFASRMGDN